jgi:predicted AlkP superfamily pyrophosphatase or phosphodiesterase
MPAPLVLINAVGLTSRLLPHAPHLGALAKAGWVRPLQEVVPAVTCTAQATFLTGKTPQEHGIVGNGWLFRDTGEIRFWQQSNRLLQAEPIYQTARKQWAARGTNFRCAKLFWWFNQGAAVDWSATPKPFYGADGNKAFGIHGTPHGLTDRLERDLGPFPFHSFWGPMAGKEIRNAKFQIRNCSDWIARCGAKIITEERPDFTLIYLPHLDYDPQRFGPEGCDMPKLVRELDEACVPVLDAARSIGARVWVVSEYGHVQVNRPVFPNRALRQAGLLEVRPGPFGEVLDTFASQAFAVCDHQVAHIYVAENALIRDAQRSAVLDLVRDVIGSLPGVARVLIGEEREELGLRHERAGDLVALSERDTWFAYPFWLDDARAPDFARTVDIHRKPGYDPCELFFDPKLWWPQGRAFLRLVQKKLGFRTLFDVVPLDASLVRGSHGLSALESADRPLLIGDGPAPDEREMTSAAVYNRLSRAFDLDGGTA